MWCEHRQNQKWINNKQSCNGKHENFPMITKHPQNDRRSLNTNYIAKIGRSTPRSCDQPSARSAEPSSYYRDQTWKTYWLTCSDQDEACLVEEFVIYLFAAGNTYENENYRLN